MRCRDHYLVTHWAGEILNELDPDVREYARSLPTGNSAIGRMQYEPLTVGKVESTVTGRRGSSNERIGNYQELMSRFRRYDWLALQAAIVDFYRDLEFVDVEGTLIDGGRDDPHRDDPWYAAIDDEPHYSEGSWPLSSFNHFIDIKKGIGRFDDFDGYSYYYGSAHRDQFQDAHEELEDWTLGDFIERIRGDKVDEGVAYWFNDEYIHAPGQPWYRNCSPSISRYSFFNEKGIYTSLEEESRARFPLADSIGRRGKGVPYSVFMPVDNLARYWYETFLRTADWLALGPVMHAIQDAAVPHHAAGYLGNWHGNYESDLRVEDWLNDINFRNEIKDLINRWSRTDPSPPQTLRQNDWRLTPAINWRIDHLVTWVALNAYHIYNEVYNHFRSGYRFDEHSAKELVKIATAISALVRKKAAEEHRILHRFPIDLVTRAPLAEWYNDLRQHLPFPGRDTDRRGFALIRPSAVLEDGRTYENVLETHPRWHDYYSVPFNQGGTIYGIYHLAMPRNAKFRTQVGFLRGACYTDGVTFEISWYIRHPVPTRFRLIRMRKEYDGKLQPIELDLRRFGGQEGDLVIKVLADRSSGQDWAVWVNPRIISE